MIRELAAAHASGSPFGSSNSVNHCTPSRRSPIVRNLWSIGNFPAAVVTTSRATWSVAPFRKPAHPNVPFTPDGSTVAAQSNGGAGSSATVAALTLSVDVHCAFRKRAACLQHVSWAIFTSGARAVVEAVGVALVTAGADAFGPMGRIPRTAP